MQSGLLRGTPAALTGDDLIAAGLVWMRADKQRLQNAPRLDRGGQIVQRLGVHLYAWLERAGFEMLNRDGPHAVLASGARLGGGITEQGGEAFAKAGIGVTRAHARPPARRRCRLSNSIANLM